MKEKKPYGETYADNFQLGDIVEWNRWEPDSEEWVNRYGVIVKIENQLLSNRLVSISTVMPIESPMQELEFFSLSLRLISRAQEKNEIFSGSYSDIS
tara:strand:+ start:321 stop:611 length:291 start_codon:yes stop_codon:yes gene_type:complete